MSDYKNTPELTRNRVPYARGFSKARTRNVLSRWYKEGLYQAIRQAKSGKKHLFCMMASLCQRQYSYWSLSKQNSQRYYY